MKKPTDIHGSQAAPERPTPSVGDWVPSDLAAAIDRLDSGSAAAYKQSLKLGQQIVMWAYTAEFDRIIVPQLPSDIPLVLRGALVEQDLYNLPLHGLSHRDLLAFGRDQAKNDAVWGVRVILGDWLRQTVFEATGRHDDPHLKRLLESALNQLWDAAAARRCFRFWTGWPGISKPPIRWTDVVAMLDGNPELETNGLTAMLERGWLPPPWFTAALS